MSARWSTEHLYIWFFFFLPDNGRCVCSCFIRFVSSLSVELVAGIEIRLTADRRRVRVRSSVCKLMFNTKLKQFGNECFCGSSDVADDYKVHGPGTCHTPCAGDDSVYCGECRDYHILLSFFVACPPLRKTRYEEINAATVTASTGPVCSSEGTTQSVRVQVRAVVRIKKARSGLTSARLCACVGIQTATARES